MVGERGGNARGLRALWVPRILMSAGKVSLVVGTVLNLVNQGPVLCQQSRISWVKAVMNYLVPFCVSAYSAAGELRRRTRE